jgi:hypothetical protein
MSIALPNPGIAAGAGLEAIRPFTFNASDEELTDLRRRIEATKWPDRETDPSQGVRLETIQALANYWAKDYHWRAFEKRFAAMPHFVTEIDGIDIHFIHVRSKHEDALPRSSRMAGLSTIEQLKIIGPLTRATARVPRTRSTWSSVPAWPHFSGKPTETGWDPHARAWVLRSARVRPLCRPGGTGTTPSRSSWPSPRPGCLDPHE